MSMGDVVADEAALVGRSAKQAGERVAQTAASGAKQVVAETTHQARGLLEQGRQQVRDQVAFQQERVALRLATVADELREMAHVSRSAPVGELVDQGAESLHQLAGWLKDQQPGDLVAEVRRFARRRPGVFLLGAALAGVVAGRLTSSGVAAVRDVEDTDSTAQRSGSPCPATSSSPAVSGSVPDQVPEGEPDAVAAYQPVVRPRTSPEERGGQERARTYLVPPVPPPPGGAASATRSQHSARRGGGGW
jgi:hypothetical protein